MYQSVKTCRTRFTDEKVQNLHKNIRKFPWAREKANTILKHADYYLAQNPDHIATLVTSHELPRSTHVNADHGCPICGREMLTHGSTSWIMDHVNRPWKLQCPHCGSLFPSNDFESYYKSGLDSHGMFSYARADKKYLVNTLYPDRDAGFAVDDGHGWLMDPEDPEHCNFPFIGFYILQGLWSHEAKPGQNTMMAPLYYFTMAYMITGDRKYGNPAAMLLGRIASVYPRMNALDCLWEKGFRLSHGLTGLGRVLGSIWDVLLMEKLVDWYDMLFDCFDQELVAYLQEDPVRYLGNMPQTPADVITNVEQLILQVFSDYKAKILNCNPGPPHALVLKSAQVLDRADLFDQYAEYLFRYIEQVQPGTTTSRRMDLETLMVANVDRDGFADEVACGYNAMWTSGFMEVAELLRGHQYDLFHHVKFRKMGNMVYQYVCADEFTLFIGDCKSTGERHIRLEKDAQVKFFLETGDVKNAQLLVKVSGDGPICTDWFADCETIDRKIREAAQQHGPFRSESRCVPCYGIAAIEAHPKGKDPESNSVYFGSNRGHGHRDTLHLNLHGFGIDMMPDLGYPDFTGVNALRYRWNSNMISHNTVTFRQEEPFPKEWEKDEMILYKSVLKTIDGGQIRHFYAGDRVSVIDAEAPNLYDAPFRRTCVTVDLDGSSRYVVDLFRAGGKQRHISYHAIGTETENTGIRFVPQRSGTYAGAQIPYADDTYNRRYCDGFNYLEQVRRCTDPKPGFAIDWKCIDNWHVWDRPRNVHLKLHMLSKVEEAALCTGKPPQTKPENPRAMTYLVAKTTGENDLFVSVLEPYEDSAFIQYAEYQPLADGAAQLVKVVHVSGRTDFVVVNLTGLHIGYDAEGFRFTTDAGFAVVSFAPDGTLAYRQEYGQKCLFGQVISFTRELCMENAVVVRLPEDTDGTQLKDRFVDIETDVEPNACFRICDAKKLPDGTWSLDVGDSTFVTGFVDRQHKELGYSYCISDGAKLRIAL